MSLDFTPLEKAADFNRRSLPLEANGGFPPEADSPSEKKPLLAQTVRERSSLTGFTFWDNFWYNADCLAGNILIAADIWAAVRIGCNCVRHSKNKFFWDRKNLQRANNRGRLPLVPMLKYHSHSSADRMYKFRTMILKVLRMVTDCE